MIEVLTVATMLIRLQYINVSNCNVICKVYFSKKYLYWNSQGVLRLDKFVLF